MKDTTLCFVLRNNQILLGLKKVGDVGEHKYNGYGGGVEQNETLEQTAKRELKEETTGMDGSGGIVAEILRKVAEIDYVFPAHESHNNQRVHVYLVDKWSGEPKESGEMTCEWFNLNNIPYDRMWDNDRHWLSIVLEGKKIKGMVKHSESKLEGCTFFPVRSFDS
jgi:8-oxo-dGTP diphosphatase